MSDNDFNARFEARLVELKVDLQTPPAPMANYVPYLRTGNMLYISGQLPLNGLKLEAQGRLGEDCSVTQGQKAARICAVNILAQARAALDGDLNRIRRILRIGGFVASLPTFYEHPSVMNGASDLFVAILGEAGQHTRTAVGVVTLPRGAPVEIDALLEVE